MKTTPIPGLLVWDYLQWEFQEPKLEVSTIYKAYVRAV